MLEQFDDVSIVAVADVDAAAGGGGGGAVRRARRSIDAAAMLDAVELDALFICVPPFAHGEPERLAIDRRLPFFVEKPVALDLGTAEDVAGAVERLGLVTAVGYHWRYLDTVDEVRALVAATPARLLSGYWLDSTPPPRWWWKRDGSGGQMLEQTTHSDRPRALFGRRRGAGVRAGGACGDRAEFPGPRHRDGEHRDADLCKRGDREFRLDLRAELEPPRRTAPVWRGTGDRVDGPRRDDRHRPRKAGPR